MEGQQYAFQPFSNDEIENLREEMKKLEISLDHAENRDSFFENPYASLMNNFNIKILKRVRFNDDFVAVFNENIRKFRPLFNKCLICKVAVMILLYTLLSYTGFIDIADIPALILASEFIKGIEDFFGGTRTEIEKLLKIIKETLKALSVPNIALQICQYFGFCSLSIDTEKNINSVRHV